MGRWWPRTLSRDPLPERLCYSRELQPLSPKWTRSGRYQHWHISESRFAARHSLIEYRRLSFWERDREYILIALSPDLRSGRH